MHGADGVDLGDVDDGADAFERSAAASSHLTVTSRHSLTSVTADVIADVIASQSVTHSRRAYLSRTPLPSSCPLYRGVGRTVEQRPPPKIQI